MVKVPLGYFFNAKAAQTYNSPSGFDHKQMMQLNPIMAKKRTLSDLIRAEVEQQSLFNIEAYSAEYSPDWAADVGSCVPIKR